MAMQDYPFVLKAAFILDKETAAYIALAVDKESNAIPDAIANLSKEEFVERAKKGTLPEDYSNELACEILPETCFVSAFTGTITTLFPEKTQSPISEVDSAGDDSFFYIPASKTSNLFSAAYASPDELLNEFKKTFSDKEIELPADFDWWQRIVEITGTTYC